MSGILYGVSVGPGDPELITLKAARILRGSTVIAAPETGSGRAVALEIAEEYIRGKKLLKLNMPMTLDEDVLERAHEAATDEICAYLSDGSDVAMITLGDISLFSTFSYIQSKIEARGYDVRIIPGVPAFCAVAAELGKPASLGDTPLRIIPGGSDDMMPQIEEALDSGDNIVIMKAGNRMSLIKTALADRGLTDCASIVERCGMNDQKVFNSIDEAGEKAEYLSTIMVSNRRARRNYQQAGRIREDSDASAIGADASGSGAIDKDSANYIGQIRETSDASSSNASSSDVYVSGGGSSGAGASDAGAIDEKKVRFVGAGPGAVDLITVRGLEHIKQAGMIIYAGSLVNKELLSYAQPDCVALDSSKMTLDEVIDGIRRGLADGRAVVRLHTGDPSIFGAIREQFDELDKHGIEYEVVPGVSSFLAAAATLNSEYTLPGVSQTVILTRIAGRTPVPDGSDIRSLASHNASMAIFLSASMLDNLATELKLGGYSPETPVALVYKASWPDELVVRTDVEHMAEEAEKNGIERTALVLVGKFLGDSHYNKSRLYAPDFSHGFRKAKS